MPPPASSKKTTGQRLAPIPFSSHTALQPLPRTRTRVLASQRLCLPFIRSLLSLTLSPRVLPGTLPPSLPFHVTTEPGLLSSSLKPCASGPQFQGSSFNCQNLICTINNTLPEAWVPQACMLLPLFLPLHLLSVETDCTSRVKSAPSQTLNTSHFLTSASFSRLWPYSTCLIA